MDSSSPWLMNPWPWLMQQMLPETHQYELPDQLDPDEWAWWQWAKEQAAAVGVSALDWLEDRGWAGVTEEQKQKMQSQALKEMNPDWQFEDKKTAALRTPQIAAVEEEDRFESYLNSAMMASLGQAMIGKTGTPAPVSLGGPSVSWTEPPAMVGQTDYRYI